jgi:hypothetical protein
LGKYAEGVWILVGCGLFCRVKDYNVRNSVLAWELAGVVFIAVAGAALHFVFELGGGWLPLALVAGVNESVWEHLKIGFWPALVYSFIEYPFLRNQVNNLWFARAVGILSISVTIVVLFYAYTAFFKDSLMVDILIFILAIMVGQMVSYRLLISRPLASWTQGAGLTLLIIMVVAFSTLSYYPPRLPLFRDPVGGGYGIQ